MGEYSSPLCAFITTVMDGLFNTTLVEDSIVIMHKEEYDDLVERANKADEFGSREYWNTPTKYVKTICEIFTTYLRSEDYQLRCQKSSHESDVQRIQEKLCEMVST